MLRISHQLKFPHKTIHEKITGGGGGGVGGGQGGTSKLMSTVGGG